MPDDDNDLLDDDIDLDVEDEEDAEDESAEIQEDAPEEDEEAPAKKAKPKKAKPAPVAEQEDQSKQMAELGLNALKAAWAEKAKAQGATAADYNSIGLKGFDAAAESAFMEEAKQSHVAKVEELKRQGFVYQPGQAELEAREQGLKEAWGHAGVGNLSASEGDQINSEINERVSNGDVTGVIDTLLGKAGGAAFFLKGRRG